MRWPVSSIARLPGRARSHGRPRATAPATPDWFTCRQSAMGSGSGSTASPSAEPNGGEGSGRTRLEGQRAAVVTLERWLPLDPDT
jgi:hypothetical protein